MKKLYNSIKHLFWLFYFIPRMLQVFLIRSLFYRTASNKSISLLQFQKYFFIRPTDNTCKLIKEFLTTSLSITEDKNFRNNSNITVICIVRNDIERIKQFLIHYRKLGTIQFSFLDDQSTDGTKEFLLQQADVELFVCAKRYTAIRRDAWINQLLLYYGFNRWFIVVDSDELLVYDNYEKNTVSALIKHCEHKKITACSAMMLDMYPRSSDLTESLSENPYKEINYFDKSGYYVDETQKHLHKIIGGMRSRYFGINPILSKTPLFYLEPGTIYVSSHYLYPFRKNFEDIGHLVLLHYKFLPGDIEKYTERISDKNMTSNSVQYAAYMEKITGSVKAEFYSPEISEKYENSQTLIKHKIMQKLDFP